MPRGMRPSSKFKVRVSLMSGEDIEIHCRGHDLVEHIKKRVAEVTNKRWMAHRLFLEGQELLRHETIISFGRRRGGLCLTAVIDADLEIEDADLPALVSQSEDDDNEIVSVS